MKNLRVALVVILAAVTGYCSAGAPAFADDLCPRLPNVHRTTPASPIDQVNPFDRDQRSVV